jgi:hypothetical protein
MIHWMTIEDGVVHGYLVGYEEPAFRIRWTSTNPGEWHLLPNLPALEGVEQFTTHPSIEAAKHAADDLLSRHRRILGG